MIKILKATIKDIDQVTALNQELFYDGYRFDNTLNVDWPKKNRKYYQEKIEGKKATTLIAKDDDQVVGYLIGSIKEEDWRKVKEIAELENMLVDKKYRGKGIGSQLIQEFIKWAKKMGMKRAKVLASFDNKDAIGVYKKNSFFEHDITLEADI